MNMLYKYEYTRKYTNSIQLHFSNVYQMYTILKFSPYNQLNFNYLKLFV